MSDTPAHGLLRQVMLAAGLFGWSTRRMSLDPPAHAIDEVALGLYHRTTLDLGEDPLEPSVEPGIDGGRGPVPAAQAAQAGRRARQRESHRSVKCCKGVDHEGLHVVRERPPHGTRAGCCLVGARPAQRFCG